MAVAGRTLTVAHWGASPAGIVMLHDGLGSIAQWRDVPAAIASRADTGVIAYDRAGHGRSTPVPQGAWPADWLHTEAVVLADLLDELGIDRPVLVGHSDGGSIALLHAAASPTTCAGVVAIAAHSWVEQVCVDAIAAMRALPEPIVAGLARFHEHPAAVFDAWSGVWTSDAFRTWDIRPLLGTITCPALVAQGEADEYATPEHLDLTAAAIGDHAEAVRIAGVGHVVHHRAPDAVVDLVAGFHAGLADAGRDGSAS